MRMREKNILKNKEKKVSKQQYNKIIRVLCYCILTLVTKLKLSNNFDQNSTLENKKKMLFLFVVFHLFWFLFVRNFAESWIKISQYFMANESKYSIKDNKCKWGKNSVKSIRCKSHVIISQIYWVDLQRSYIFRRI